ncbi:hypothetical protein PTSG_04807 [Salpingoeca rosetta]|uniref:F-box domain-containing protein n=1 Tax=Salpingoeca rosetta (strain ATCC 50818 / BSB-021) TaxID=946362 RepID=F2U9R7_SALR5|nr:uncharacterized protein PTSG_04807 [Salpingoeca rosetta]EGD73094.1 hypothetical protein PTSG_04807 [Salpingoeca rosetta]|eukprot:XP_004994125.1 hypothetical protein PTSG_04807 [Salpingoeca rosetta]
MAAGVGLAPLDMFDEEEEDVLMESQDSISFSHSTDHKHTQGHTQQRTDCHDIADRNAADDWSSNDSSGNSNNSSSGGYANELDMMHGPQHTIAMQSQASSSPSLHLTRRKQPSPMQRRSLSHNSGIGLYTNHTPAFHDKVATAAAIASAETVGAPTAEGAVAERPRKLAREVDDAKLWHVHPSSPLSSLSSSLPLPSTLSADTRQHPHHHHHQQQQPRHVHIAQQPTTDSISSRSSFQRHLPTRRPATVAGDRVTQSAACSQPSTGSRDRLLAAARGGDGGEGEGEASEAKVLLEWFETASDWHRLIVLRHLLGFSDVRTIKPVLDYISSSSGKHTRSSTASTSAVATATVGGGRGGGDGRDESEAASSSGSKISAAGGIARSKSRTNVSIVGAGGEKMDIIAKLPSPLAKFILSQLDFNTLTRASRVSPTWRALSKQVMADQVHSQDARDLLMDMHKSSAGSRHPVAVEIPYATEDGLKMLQLTEQNVFCGPSSVIMCDGMDDTRVVGYAGGDIAVTGSADKLLRFYDIHTGFVVAKVSGHAGSIRSVAVSPTFNIVLSGSYDSSARVWDLTTRKCLGILRGHKSTVTAVHVDDDSGTAATGSRDRRFIVWDAPSRQMLKSMATASSVTSVYAGCGYACCGMQEGEVLVVHVDTHRKVKSLKAHDGVVHAVAVDAYFFVSGGEDGIAHLWSLQPCTSEPVTSFRHVSAVTSAHMMQCRTITGCDDGKIRIWNNLDGSCIKIFRGNSASRPVRHLCLHGGTTMVVNTTTTMHFQLFASSSDEEDEDADAEGHGEGVGLHGRNSRPSSRHSSARRKKSTDVSSRPVSRGGRSSRGSASRPGTARAESALVRQRSRPTTAASRPGSRAASRPGSHAASRPGSRAASRQGSRRQRSAREGSRRDGATSPADGAIGGRSTSPNAWVERRQRPSQSDIPLPSILQETLLAGMRPAHVRPPSRDPSNSASWLMSSPMVTNGANSSSGNGSTGRRRSGRVVVGADPASIDASLHRGALHRSPSPQRPPHARHGHSTSPSTGRSTPAHSRDHQHHGGVVGHHVRFAHRPKRSVSVGDFHHADPACSGSGDGGGDGDMRRSVELSESLQRMRFGRQFPGQWRTLMKVPELAASLHATT